MNKKTPNNALNRLDESAFKNANKTPIIIVLDNVRSAQNVGSIFRTADSFLIEEIVLCGITPSPPSREINKTALGATQTVAWSYVDDTMTAIKLLQERGVNCLAIEQTENSVELGNYKTRRDIKYAFVFGNEVEGVSQEVIDLCQNSIEVPQFGTKHSLNIAVCTGIVVWDFFKLLKLLK